MASRTEADQLTSGAVGVALDTLAVIFALLGLVPQRGDKIVLQERLVASPADPFS
jgi:hypothetical protein